MSVRAFFTEFEPRIRQTFERAKADAGCRARHVRLELTDRARGAGAKADIYVLPDGTVRLTWCAIAALWTASRAVAIILRKVEEARKAGIDKVMVAGDADGTAAMNLLVLCRRFYLDDFPYSIWVDWAPRPLIAPDDKDARAGNILFEGALAWMLRHEVAHIFCRHDERQVTEGLTTRTIEHEADSQATTWFKQGLAADPNRKLTAPPDRDERLLEFRGLLLGLGLVWVGMLEASIAQRGADYPTPAERLFACLGQLGLREDSAAAQWLAEIIHAWIDPEANWGPPGGHQDAQAFFSEAVFHLHRYLAGHGGHAGPKAA